MSDGSSKPKFSEMFRSALAPRPPIEVDKDAPNPVPRGVKVSGWLAIASGLLNLLVGALNAILRHSFIDDAVVQLNTEIATCNANGTGIGAAVTSTDTSDAVTLCKSLQVPTQAMIDNALSSSLTFGLILAVVGAASIFGGFGVIRGAVWARRLLTPLGALLLIGTMLGLLSGWLIFGAALLMLVALTQLYVGKGANYYIRAKAKGVK